jgi:hypothetical protein
VNDQIDLSTAQAIIAERYSKFLQALETTNMTKSYKMVLLKAFLELDGFNQAPSLSALSKRSWYVLSRYPLLHADLSQTFLKLMAARLYDEPKWLSYWRKNPIRAWLGENKSTANTALFELKGDVFAFKSGLTSEVEPTELALMILEIIDFRLLTYKERKIAS